MSSSERIEEIEEYRQDLPLRGRVCCALTFANSLYDKRKAVHRTGSRLQTDEIQHGIQTVLPFGN